MQDQSQQFSKSFKLVLGILIGMSAGQVALADSDKQAAALTGQQVYNNVCIACHAAPGIGGAPALGDSDVWGERISHGIDTLKEHALQGYSGNTGIMPKKGGRIDLSDEEIIAAVEYMVEQIDK